MIKTIVETNKSKVYFYTEIKSVSGSAAYAMIEVISVLSPGSPKAGAAKKGRFTYWIIYRMHFSRTFDGFKIFQQVDYTWKVMDVQGLSRKCHIFIICIGILFTLLHRTNSAPQSLQKPHFQVMMMILTNNSFISPLRICFNWFHF